MNDANEFITMERAYLASWLKSNVLGDVEYDFTNATTVSSYTFSESGFENPMELQKEIIEVLAVEVNKINFEEEDTWPKPVELTGVGENLDATREADLIRLKDILKKKLKGIPVQIFGKK
eukprot:snap_masked-scaffold_45-processed-gene-1.102-mRNA-1 protein AED:1.00 eAED:1.00 QI:0/0/0/0/1/1/2/0/119